MLERSSIFKSLFIHIILLADTNILFKFVVQNR